MKILKRNKGKWKVLLIILVVGFGLLQLTGSKVTNPPVEATFTGPAEVMNILKRSCYDCHSNETKLVWYDLVAPVSWLVAKDVEAGRKVLNFSDWGKWSKKKQNNTLYNIANFVMLGAMPLPNYLTMHPGAKVSTQELEVLKNYALSKTAGLTPVQVKGADNELNGTDFRSEAGLRMISDSLDKVLTNARIKERRVKVDPAPNGIAYPRGYGNWELVSTTDRFDNHTFRAIFGNEIAVKAIKAGQIQPWPDGAVLAKVLWKEQIDGKGVIMPGAFIHAEFMIKDAAMYKDTDGWGWARWVGPDLKPYGNSPAFVAECTNCHAPMKDKDFVFTMPLNLKTDQ